MLRDLGKMDMRMRSLSHMGTGLSTFWVSGIVFWCSLLMLFINCFNLNTMFKAMTWH